MRSWRQPWVYAAVLAGLLYAIVGITFAIPASNGRAWRLAAWAISIVLYMAQVAYEHFALRHSARSTAFHVAAAAALGAFGLAIGANLHSLLARPTEQHPSLLLISLLVWPIITGVPAFLVGLMISGVFSFVSRARSDAT